MGNSIMIHKAKEGTKGATIKVVANPTRERIFTEVNKAYILNTYTGNMLQVTCTNGHQFVLPIENNSLIHVIR